MSRLRRHWPELAGAGFVALLAGHLLDPGRLLLVRDVPLFNLPLRAAFARLAAGGLPEWNPDLAGGQPLLADPSYAAFYPPTWLLLAVPPAYSISLHVLLHLLVAAWGAAALARRLGARPAVAALAAVAYAGGGAVLSFVPSLNFLPGAAWLPWALAAGHATLAARGASEAQPAGLGLAAVLAAILLAGEPVTALAAGIAVALLALDLELAALPAAVGRLALAGAAAAGLAAAQLAPALARLGGSIRSGLPASVALLWSLPPARALELVLPRVWGDPMRVEEGLWFGERIHDRGFPFLLSLHVSTVLLALALAALLRWPIPHRRAWAGMLALGTFLALGQHCAPAAAALRGLPLLASTRYPEKLAGLALAALVFAGALGAEHLLRERQRRPALAGLPLALAALPFAAAALAALAVRQRPDLVLDLARAAVGVERAGAGAIVAFARGQALLALAATGTALVAIALARWPRAPASLAASALLAAAALDLYAHHRGFLPTGEARRAVEPPPLARELAPGTRRIWTTAGFDEAAEPVGEAGGEPRATLLARLDRLDHWSALVWGRGYALTSDPAFSFTPPAGRALRIAVELWKAGDRERFLRFAGAWSIDEIVAHRSPREIADERRAGGGRPLPARLLPNPRALPHARFVARAVSHADPTTAIRGLLADAVQLGAREHLVAAPFSGEVRFDPTARVLATTIGGDEVEIEVETAAAALLVVASTWDSGWSAEVDGGAAPVLESVAGYLAVPVPAGARRVRLVYRDRPARLGMALSLLTAAGLALVAVRHRATARAGRADG